MFKHNLFYKSLLAASIVTIAASSNAEETVTVTASVTVSNAFDLDLDNGGLNFGTIRATQDLSAGTLTSGAGIRILADGSGAEEINPVVDSGTSSVSQASVIVDGSPALFLIENAAANTNMTLSIPEDSVVTTIGGGIEVFDLKFTTNDVWIINEDGTEIAYNGGNLTTNATGTVRFALGGSLTIKGDEDGTNLTDSSFTGDFAVVVDY
jgi:hypothetical protein